MWPVYLYYMFFFSSNWREGNTHKSHGEICEIPVRQALIRDTAFALTPSTNCNFTLSKENHLYFARNCHRNAAGHASSVLSAELPWLQEGEPLPGQQGCALSQDSVSPWTNTNSGHVLRFGLRLCWLCAFPLVVCFLSNLLQPHANCLPLNAKHWLWGRSVATWSDSITHKIGEQPFRTVVFFFFHLEMQRYLFAWQSSVTLTQIKWQLRTFQLLERCFWCTSQGCLENNNVWFEKASRHIASGCNK